MLMLIPILLFAGSASVQQLFTQQANALPREAESILIASCRRVGERLAVPMPDPKVELRLGEKDDAVDSVGNVLVIHMRGWNKALFKVAAVYVCMRDAELRMVHAIAKEVRDY